MHQSHDECSDSKVSAMMHIMDLHSTKFCKIQYQEISIYVQKKENEKKEKRNHLLDYILLDFRYNLSKVVLGPVMKMLETNSYSYRR